jgi:hypothetical protein
VKLLTEDSKLVCAHQAGIVDIEPSQTWVTVAGRRVLVATDPEGRDVNGCPNIGVGIRPCKNTLKVKKGYSSWVEIDDHGTCLDDLQGLTDGTPPGVVLYLVEDPGQPFVWEQG